PSRRSRTRSNRPASGAALPCSCAFIEEVAGIRSHAFLLGKPAKRASARIEEPIRSRLAEGFAQHALFYTPARTAPSQLPVNHDRRHATDAMLRGPACRFLLMHVMHHHF